MKIRSRNRRFFWLIAAAFHSFPAAQAAPADPFAETIAPVLQQNCLPCHDEKTRTSGLSVGSEISLLTGGARRGPAIQPGKPDESVLIKTLRGQIEPRMPLGRQPLSEEKIALLAAWIRNLQPGERTAAPAAGPSKWWAFRAPQRVDPPQVKNRAWVRNGIDNFVLRKLEDNGLSPAPEASARMLLRRAFFDLIGLPPSPAEADLFLQDKSAGAYEKLIDRLLADPRYGERWGRHWLDLARYADSRGFEGDLELSHAWRYRDYVIQAFNEDKPYDRFIKEQLAADELAREPEALVALGFLRLSPWFAGGGTAIQVRQILLDEVTSTVGSVFLGLTLKCAQCHDHKYDPIPQKDYYRLQAFFAPLEFTEERVEFGDPDLRARMDARRAEAAARLKSAEENFKKYQGTLLAKLREPDLRELTKRLVRDDAGTISASQDRTFTDEEKQRYVDLLALVDPTSPVNRQPGLLRRQLARCEPVAHTVKNAGGSPLAPNRPLTHVLLGGEWDKLGALVEPGFLSAITGNSDRAVLPVQGFGDISRFRTVLADWIANSGNPLTARVMANRIWQFHFGTGIVATASDFGKNGARPTHPELLDWLALQFVEKKWSIKAMHRLIMTSSAYRQSSVQWTEAAAKLDPGNTLLWRMNRQRLEGESLRDSILAVSGRLNPERAGPGIFPPLPEELAHLKTKNRLVWEPGDGPEARRRSVYITQRRQLEVPLLKVMDAPALNDSCERRFVSTTALQALSLMNGQLVTDESKYFAQRVAEKAGPDKVNQIRLAFELALARPPEAAEIARAQEYLNSGGDLTGFCRILFNTNEFIYVR